MQCRRRSIPTATAAVAAVCLLAAGCGSGSPGSSSAAISSSDRSQAEGQQQMVRFSRCMRSHGVQSFPDPGSRAFKNALAANSPAVHSALTTCRHLMPGGGPPNESPAHTRARMAAMLAFARCMRSHGFGGFPDPTTTGQLTHEMLAKAGIDIHQPAAVETADGCTSVTHGLLTKADVARFVAGH